LLLQDITDQFSSIIDGKKQKIDLKMPPSLPVIQADRKRIEQILFNFLSNASKFTSRGSTIAVSCSCDKNNLAIEVKDAGPSIPQEVIDRLLDPEYHIETDRQRFPGLGIGFALAKHLVELHNGKIWIKSEEGSGNTFAFSLPLA
jgi:signal transduction histidine kinase